ncbi:Arylsulfatase [Arcticibacter svalbardensis MN12-7]|uniref:Arylsulfatase n=1 Tax=Arcticibacter svalbardensis MN12-7 TaxID=1150600 RepID=R9GQ18_9SPHI|nr:sulfatase-like hydrolase/transferase [Arcticibacter svalbardensis]EOR93811.1 Arylsulfatase [Arcticibacter svalbardensis MN12-7]
MIFKKAKYKIFVITLLLAQNISFAKIIKDADAKPKTKPNVIFILLDDLGVGDVGVFFQDQRRLANQRNRPFTITPYLDEMAKKGATLEQYCAAPVCAPSRSSILLGQSQGHANVRDNQFDKALANNYTLGNVMQMAGYTTTAIGKWGLQGNGKIKDATEWPAHPLKRGFDEYMGYIRHGDGHEHYPKEGIYTGKKEVYDGYKEISNDLDKCYTGDLFTAAAKKYIVKHSQRNDKAKPFFMYLAYDTPHAVLELPTQAYPKGFGLKGGLQWTGKAGKIINTANGTPDSWMDTEYANATYDDDNNPLTSEVPWPDTYKRYATITKRIDNQVHDILMLLKDLKIDKNTLVIFTSDNGPSRESYLPKNHVEYNPTFFGSSGLYDGIKRDVWEGGVRMPTIAYWPTHIKSKMVIDKPSISYDWMATFLDVAGLSSPVRSDGISLLPLLTGKGKQKDSQIYIEYFENGKTPNYEAFDVSHRNRVRKQMQMIRLGDTVAVRYNIQSAADDFEIYNIRKDPKQIVNLAKIQNLSRLQSNLKARALQMRLADSGAKRPYDNALIPADNVDGLIKGLRETVYQNETSWISAPTNFSNAIVVNNIRLENSNQNAVLFDAYVLIPEDGTYTFGLQTTGKAFLRLHDIALIDEDFNYQAEQKSEILNLAKGYHHFKLYYKKGVKKGDEVLHFTCFKQGEQNVDLMKNTYANK